MWNYIRIVFLFDENLDIMMKFQNIAIKIVRQMIQKSRLATIVLIGFRFKLN